MVILPAIRVSQLATVRRRRVDNTWLSQRWLHAMKPYIGRKSRFLRAPACNACVRGVSVELSPWRSVWKKIRIVWLLDSEKFWRYIYSFRQNTRTWQTDGHRMTAQAARSCIASRGKTDLYSLSDSLESSFIHSSKSCSPPGPLLNMSDVEGCDWTTPSLGDVTSWSRGLLDAASLDASFMTSFNQLFTWTNKYIRTVKE